MPTSYSPVTTTGAAASGSPCTIAHVAQDVAALVQRRRVGPHRRLGVGQRLEHLVLDADRVGGVARRLGVVGGDDRDRLALEAHVLPGQHGLVGVLEAVGAAGRARRRA